LIGNHIFIKDLINLISKISGFSGKIIWDKNKSSGQEKRFLQVSRAHNLSFKCKMPLDEGLKITIDWYKKNISKN
jgi:GDP-L-fucose synthase